MHSLATAPQSQLDLITNVLSLLLVSSLTVRSFTGRWQVIRSKLTSLHSSLSSISESPHWNENPLLHNLFPSLLALVQRLKALSDQCILSSWSGGKLLMQSDLDIASASLSNSLADLDLLLRSGVLHQSNAIVLSQPGPGSGKHDLCLFIRDLFTRLQIGGIDFKIKALESLVQLLDDDDKSASLVAKEGNIGYLINLLDLNNQALIPQLAVLAVSVLASSSDVSRKVIFEQGGLGPLLRILELGSIPLKEKAAIAIEAITIDPDNAWAISAYGGVSVLVEACRSGSQATKTHAVGAIRNVVSVEDIKMAFGEEGAVPVLVQLLFSGTVAAQEKTANCLAVLASSGEYLRCLIIKEQALPRLMHLIQDASISETTVQHILRVITNSLSQESGAARIVSSSTAFIIQLGEFIKHGNAILQQLSASLLPNLSISDGNKRAIASCMPSLVKLMESPKPVGLQEAATQAVVSLLTVRSNRKELVRDEKSMMRLVQMLDPENEIVAKKFPLMVTAGLLSSGEGCRKRVAAAGAEKHLQRLAEMEAPGAKKALQRLTGNRLKNMILSRTWRE